MGDTNNLVPFTPDMCTCCGSKQCYKDIKTEYNWMGQSEVYEQMIYTTFDVTIYQDNSSQTQPQICELCVQRLRDACNFKKQIVECQRTLVEHYNSYRNNASQLLEVKLEIKMEPFAEDDSMSEEDEDKIEVNSTRRQSSRRINRDSTEESEAKKKLDSDLISNEDAANDVCSNDDDLEFSKGPEQDITPEEIDRRKKLKKDTMKILKNTNITPFRWHRNKYQCFCCKYCSDDISDTKKHTKKHSFEEIKKEIENKHLYHKAEVTSIKCSICKELINFMELKNHLRSHNITFNLEDDLLIPFLLQNSLQCAVCDEKFQVFHALNVHMNSHYKNHICTLCGQTFVNESSFKNHVDRHNKIYKCRKCDLLFVTEHQREKHNVKIHKNRPKRVCGYCPVRFKSHYSRLLHMIKEHDHKKPEYKCPSCDKIFLRQFLVNSHVRKFHMKERRYECSVCSQKFFGLFDMNQHFATHGGRKKFPCSFCAKSYSRKWNLNDHVSKMHKDEEVTENN